MCCKCYSPTEGEYLRFGNDDRPSNARASPGTSLLRNGAAGHGESVHKAQTSDHFGHLYCITVDDLLVSQSRLRDFACGLFFSSE